MPTSGWALQDQNTRDTCSWMPETHIREWLWGWHAAWMPKPPCVYLFIEGHKERNQVHPLSSFLRPQQAVSTSLPTKGLRYYGGTFSSTVGSPTLKREISFLERGPSDRVMSKPNDCCCSGVACYAVRTFANLLRFTLRSPLFDMINHCPNILALSDVPFPKGGTFKIHTTLCYSVTNIHTF